MKLQKQLQIITLFAGISFNIEDFCLTTCIFAALNDVLPV
jgi:hypothetical protein